MCRQHNPLSSVSRLGWTGGLNRRRYGGRHIEVTVELTLDDDAELYPFIKSHVITDTPAALSQQAPALEVKNLSFAYGAKQVLDDVSFKVPTGRVTFLLGPNGAGKSTLFSLITRLFDARQGRVRILGADLKNSGAKALSPLAGR